MNRPITAKTALLKISTLFLIPFFLFMLGLNVDSYLQVQQTELQYYQIQIRPHLFLNCMKNLYAMAAAWKYAQMQEMILTLSEYLRAVLKDHDMIVPLGKKLDSVRSYVKLQQMSSASQGMNIDTSQLPSTGITIGAVKG